MKGLIAGPGEEELERRQGGGQQMGPGCTQGQGQDRNKDVTRRLSTKVNSLTWHLHRREHTDFMYAVAKKHVSLLYVFLCLSLVQSRT